MPLPAQRIRQLRAIFAQANKKNKIVNRRIYGSFSAHEQIMSKIGSGWTSAHIQARRDAARRLRQFRAGLDPNPMTEYPMNVESVRVSPSQLNRRHRLPAKYAADRGRGDQFTDRRYYTLTTRKDRARLINELTTIRFKQRLGQRNLYRAMRKPE